MHTITTFRDIMDQNEGASSDDDKEVDDDSENKVDAKAGVAGETGLVDEIEIEIKRSCHPSLLEVHRITTDVKMEMKNQYSCPTAA